MAVLVDCCLHCWDVAVLDVSAATMHELLLFRCADVARTVTGTRCGPRHPSHCHYAPSTLSANQHTSSCTQAKMSHSALHTEFLKVRLRIHTTSPLTPALRSGCVADTML